MSPSRIPRLDDPSSWNLQETQPDPSIPPLSEAEILAFRDGLAPELRDDQWYLILLSALSALHRGAETIVPLYTLVTLPLTALPSSHAQRIHSRFQETLVKGSVLYGISPSLDGIFALLADLRTHHPSHLLGASHFPRSHSPLHSRSLDQLSTRANEGLGRVYRHNLAPITDDLMRDDMQDLKFLTLQINYGWNLAEEAVLPFRDTEVVVLAALVVLNARKECLWHLRGARRAGWSDEQVESVRRACLILARRFGMRTDEVPSLSDVTEDSND